MEVTVGTFGQTREVFVQGIFFGAPGSTEET